MNVLSRTMALLKLSWAMMQVVRNPNRLDRVIAISDDLARDDKAMLQGMVDEAARTPYGTAAFTERPRIPALHIDALLKSPSGSLGHELGVYFQKNNLNPKDLPTRSADNTFDYLVAHLYETHDIWHVVTGFETDVAGELGLQAFYAAQLPSKLPLVILVIGFLNSLFFEFEDRGRRFDAIVRGWTLGRRAKSLFGIRWGDRWNEPLATVRRSVGLEELRSTDREGALNGYTQPAPASSQSFL